MPYTKTLICLAASRKLAGTCIAGKEIEGNEVKSWIRPVSQLHTGELSVHEIALASGGTPRVLDILRIQMLRHSPHGCQTENHIIDSHVRWKKEGVLNKDLLEYLVDTPERLWINSYQSGSGLNDRVPDHIANLELSSSLYLIHPDSLIIVISTSFNKRKARARFDYGGVKYSLMITDPEMERRYFAGPDGVIHLSTDQTYLCVSLGESFETFRYKLIASLIDFQ